MIKLFSQFLSGDQINIIANAPRKDRSHPTKKLFCNDNKNLYVYYNTEFALSKILSEDKPWLESQKDKLSAIDDYSTASAAIGEIRAYGYLIGAGFQVAPITPSKNDNTPDFVIKNSEGEEIEVEVNSKQYSEDESLELEKFNSQTNSAQHSSTTIREHVVTPFGKPKPGENVTENVISKLTAIKQNEKQFSPDKPSILWLDFQDELWTLGLKVDSTQPIRTWREEFYSGELWYAFYGKKGLTIFEQSSVEPRIKSNITMRHEGRYRYDSKIDATIISLPEHTVILENPFSKNKLPNWFWDSAVFINRLNFENSWTNWPENRLKERIETEEDRIKELSVIARNQH